MSTEPVHSPYHAPIAHFRSLINKEGKFNIHGNRRWQSPFNDLYHYFLSLSWLKFFLHIAAFYSVLNLFFGTLYFLEGVDALGGGNSSGWTRFSHCIFLSVENMTAVDYGKVDGQAGAGVYTLMTIQAFLGLLTIAVMTGLFYARFSRATARVVFSNKAIIGTHNGRKCLFFRIANERLNQIAEAHMTLHMTRNEISLEGEHMRKFYDLDLERGYSPLFALSWTVRHYIDEASPLFEMTPEKMHEMQMGLLASMSGTDETFGQPIFARRAYAPEDILYNRRFKDIIVWHGQKVHINLKGIHDLHEVQTAQ